MCAYLRRLIYPAPMAVRRQAGKGISELASFDQRAYEWLSSKEAEDWAQKLLSQHRLGIDPKEITSDAMFNIHSLVTANPERFIGENWENGRADHYSIRVMRNLIVDVLRGRKRSPFALLEEKDGGHFDSVDETITDIDVLLHEGTPSGHEAGGGELLDRLRTALEGSGAKPWAVSAALSAFTLSAFDEIETGKAPRPEAGAKPQHARLWPSLWFAGERDVFDKTGSGSSTALRRKRSRRMKEVEDLMFNARSRCDLGDLP
jgi:hypothetical protein